MNRKLFYTVIAVCMQTSVFAQVTKVGNDTLLDVANWNIEWFGDISNGPSDEALQYANVKSVLKNTDIDVWGLEEVSDPTTFSTLLADLAVYDAISSTFSQTQKTALIWKKNKFELVSFGNVLTQSTYSYDFAGRPPLEVVLVSKDNNIADTLYFYVLHLKANTGSQTEKVASYNRRKNAAAHLKTYLDANRMNQKVFVLGDWNDDLDESIVYDNGSYLPTPFSNFLNDTAHYFYPSLRLTMTGGKSTASYNNMIDHQLITNYLRDSFYIPNSSLVMMATAAQVSGYANTTSDHYPILSRYNMKRQVKPGPPPTGLIDLSGNLTVNIFPNPAAFSIHIETAEPLALITMVNSIGAVVAETSSADMDVSSLPNGLYFLHVSGADGVVTRKVVIQH
ncbi:MAG: T9SS type A sorting domain-containing protein [Bacteroidota bacterium]